MSGQYTLRFRAFAAAGGAKPENIRPGDEFIAWINARWTEFCAAHKVTVRGTHHAEFDAWLSSKYGVQP